MSTNKYLALLLSGLALLSLLLSLIVPKGLNLREQPNFISVLDVAEMIKSRKDIKIIDLRSRMKYDSFHLPTAIRMDMDHLAVTTTDGPLILYSGDDGLVRECWKSIPDPLKRNTFILYGGVHDWFDRILYPRLPLKPKSKPEEELSSYLDELSAYFGGQAKFEEKPDLLKYYTRDVTGRPWPTAKRKNGLVRMGC